jgi:hypothetical protein
MKHFGRLLELPDLFCLCHRLRLGNWQVKVQIRILVLERKSASLLDSILTEYVIKHLEDLILNFLVVYVKILRCLGKSSRFNYRARICTDGLDRRAHRLARRRAHRDLDVGRAAVEERIGLIRNGLEVLGQRDT